MMALCNIDILRVILKKELWFSLKPAWECGYSWGRVFRGLSGSLMRFSSWSRNTKRKFKLPGGGKKPLKKGPSGSTAKKKGVSFLEEAAAAADAGEGPLPILETPRQAVRLSPEEKEDGETEEGEKSLRKSTRTSVIVRQAERDAQRAIQQALPKVRGLSYSS